MRHSPYPYAFGDEVGDVGFTFAGGASRFFLAVVLLLNDPEPLRQQVDRLRQQLGLPAHVEFKFHKTSDGYRRAFLKALTSHDFAVRALYVDKTSLPRMKGQEFYAFCFGELFRRMPTGELGETTLMLDRFGGAKPTLQALRRHLKTKPHPLRPFKRISFCRSRSENLLQVTDMIGGAIYRELTEGDGSFLDPVRGKVSVWRLAANENPPN